VPIDETRAPRSVVVVLFDRFELLDVFGPLELFGALPDRFKILLLGEKAGPARTSCSCPEGSGPARSSRTAPLARTCCDSP
jgi:hypothetical protein